MKLACLQKNFQIVAKTSICYVYLQDFVKLSKFEFNAKQKNTLHSNWR